uniref:Uncharacterized protein n=1 Tax=Arundo donax TaxID=35708 RepID=A0A0A9B872_ARUDO
MEGSQLPLAGEQPKESAWLLDMCQDQSRPVRPLHGATQGLSTSRNKLC